MSDHAPPIRHRVALAATAIAVVATATFSAGVAATAAAPTVLQTGDYTDPTAPPQTSPGKRTDKTLVIGIDGARLDVIERRATPNLHELMERGTTSSSQLYAPVDHPEMLPGTSTSSGPGWSTILSGTWPDEHGVRDNDFAGKDFERYPSFLDRMEAVDPALSTFAAADWDPIATDTAHGPIVTSGIDARFGVKADAETGYDVGDQLVQEAAEEYLRTRDPDAAFVYFGKTDIAGHDGGADSEVYGRSLEQADARIGAVLDAVEQRATRAEERWTVIVTTDHGHLPGGGHGGADPTERATFVIAAGDGIAAGERRTDVHPIDVAATVLTRAGIDLEATGLRGAPVGTRSDDGFDVLRAEVGERHVVHHGPSGWRVENDGAATAGGSGWDGWTFTDQATWSAAGRREGRENFVAGRDVIAVADTAARGGGAAFDTTLVTPPIDVAGRSALQVDFDTEFEHAGDQRGVVEVAWDGGAPTPVRVFDGAFRGHERERVAVPAGAAHAEVRFRHTGADGWYWALDDVRTVASGTAPDPGPDPEPTPGPTVAPDPTTSPDPGHGQEDESVAPTAGAGQLEGNGPGRLAYTGAELWTWAAFAAVLLAAGAVLWIVVRSRRRVDGVHDGRHDGP